LSHALKTLDNPAVTQEQISDLLILNSETVLVNKQAKNLKKKLETTSKVLHTHMQDLKLKGVKIENEE
jgi:biotin operon repressor